MIYVEDKPQEILVEELGLKAKGKGGKGNVVENLKEKRGAIGVVDEDPWDYQPPYLRNLKEGEKNHGVIVKEDKERGNKVLILCPRWEEWIIDAIKEAKIKIESFPLDPSKLREIPWGKEHNRNKLRMVYRELKEKGSRHILFLKKLLGGKDGVLF